MRNDDINAPETEDDAREVGHLRMARWRHQNAQLLGKKPRLWDKEREDQPVTGENDHSTE